MAHHLTPKLSRFLQAELKIPMDTLLTASDKCDSIPNLIPIQLWQSGAVSLEQLDQIFDWMESTYKGCE